MTIHADSPRSFFENHVRKNFEAWLADPLAEHLAKNAVGDANVMAARALLYWRDRDPSRVYGATSEGDYRDALATNECSDFALVRDVADAHKHGSISRKNRYVTRSDQTSARARLGRSHVGRVEVGATTGHNG